MKTISVNSIQGYPTTSVAQAVRKAAPASNRWLATTLLSVALLSTDVALTADSIGDDVQTGNASTLKPAYRLKVIAYGEGMPEGDNFTESGLQQNRRVDVAFKGVPVSIPKDAEVNDGEGAIWLTQDPLSTDRVLNINSAASVAAGDASGASVKLNIYSNYAAFVDRWEVLFYRADDVERTEAVASVTGDSFANESVLEWNGVLNDGYLVEPGDEFTYVLRVYDANGRIDETYPGSLSILGPERYLAQSEEGFDVSLQVADELRRRSRLAREEIPLQGARVRIYGRDLGDIRSVQINGEDVTLDLNNEFAAEYLRGFGLHEFTVTVNGSNGETFTRILDAELKGEYMFMVGLADVTAGKNRLRGFSSLDVQDRERFDGDIFVDGRLAFYLKGKVKGKYLVTAQMDTGREEIDEVFNGLSRKDNTSVFRRLDPEQYYPVYGDDATLIDDTDSQGKLYVRVDWDQSRALWGNFNTGMTGTELAQFNRSLYGAQLKARSQEFTSRGDHKTDVNAFVSEAQSASRHVEFKGTGGSLYYLRDTDIVQGSEKLWVEVRQRDTGRVIDRVALMGGKDYQIDDIQGRIILNRPLRTVGDEIAPSIIKDTPLDGNELWLIADYEYAPESLSPDDMTAGVRGKHWLSDKLAVGGTWVLEKRSGSDHEIKGIDATITAGAGSWIRAEYAQSEAVQTVGSFISNNGGLDFDDFNSNGLNQGTSGDAYSVEAKADLTKILGWQNDATLGAWTKRRDKGFSSGGIDTGADTTDNGVEATLQLNEALELSARATNYEQANRTSRTTTSLQAEYDISDRLSVAAEMRGVNEKDLLAATSGKGSLAALQVGVDVSDRLNVYGSLQSTLDSSGEYESNDLLTLGAKSRSGKRMNFNIEGSSGDRGESLLAGVDYRVTDSYSVYFNQTLSTDRTDDNNRRTATVGQRHNASNKLRLYTEHQFSDDDQEAGLGHTFGLNYKVSEYTNLNGSVNFSDLEDDSGDNIERNALSLGIAYRHDKTRASSRIELRRDRGATFDTEQWLTANSFNYAMSPSTRWQGKLNYSDTTDSSNGQSDARFTEAGVGFAYRPVSHNRLNMLARLTHKHDLPPLSQLDAVDEKSLVGSVEMAYQINRLWEAGGKLALKSAEVRNQRNTGSWSDNDAKLTAARLRYHLLFRWDALAEYHWLESDASDDSNHGALLSIGKHVGDNLKFSVGYNFTNFDDSLLNDDADVKGWFVNLVGKY